MIWKPPFDWQVSRNNEAIIVDATGDAVPPDEVVLLLNAQRAEVGAPDPFTVEVCDDLFGSFLRPRYGEGYICVHCEQPIDELAWVNAVHGDDCIINRARAFLAKHKPESVRDDMNSPRPKEG